VRTNTYTHCWLLHARAYRDSSLLLDLFTVEEGRVGAVARGVRTASKGNASGKRSLLQPFVPLQVALSGRGELRTLGQVEAVGPCIAVHGERLLSALYINELLVRLLPNHEKEGPLFEEYSTLLPALAGDAPLEPLLRNFELQLLDALGYGLQFGHDVETGEAIQPDGWYHLHVDGGFGRQLAAGQHTDTHSLYAGSELLSIAQRDFAGDAVRRTAKRLLRRALQQHLGKRELGSRLLFSKPTVPQTSTS
jgi:DNA repair protein RecO (recombination protein O)